MDSLFAFVAAPTAVAAAAAAAGRAVARATQPFAEMLSALDDDAPPPPADGPHDELIDRIGARLRELFAAAGVEPGQSAVLRFDGPTGHVDVDHASPLAGDVAALIEADADLMGDLRELADRESAGGELELLVPTS